MSSFVYWVLKDAPEVPSEFFTHYRKHWPSTKRYFGVYDFVGHPDPLQIERTGLTPYVFDIADPEDAMMRTISASSLIKAFGSQNNKWKGRIEPLLKRSIPTPDDLFAYPWDVTWENLKRYVR